MRCCLIGGAGFIGKRVASLLVEQGYEVVVVNRDSKRPSGLPHSVHYVAEDPAALRETLSRVDQVIDLAYSTVPKTSFEDPVLDIISNVPRSIRLFQQCSAASIRRLIVVSSGGTVYGVAKTIPISEDHPTNPISPYGITKLAVEKYAKMFQATANLPVIIVRPANAYGESQVVSDGQGFIAAAVRSILMQKEVDVYGPYGTVRDYVHVSDIASGIIAALEYGELGEIYNIGSGIGHSNLDVLDLLTPYAEQAGYAVDVNTLPSREFDVPVNILDSTKLKSASRWASKITLGQGLRLTWDAAVESFRRY